MWFGANCYDHIKPHVDLLAHGSSRQVEEYHWSAVCVWISADSHGVDGAQPGNNLSSSVTPFEREQPSIDEVNIASSSSKHRVTGCNPERTVQMRLDSSEEPTEPKRYLTPSLATFGCMLKSFPLSSQICEQFALTSLRCSDLFVL